MIIKKITSSSLKEDSTLSGFFYPDQFVAKKTLKSPSYIKKIMDFFASTSFNQLQHKKEVIKNYKLRNGEFDFKDFENTDLGDEMRNLISDVVGDVTNDDFAYLKHYPIINSPLHTLKGELIGRPRKERVKALDDITNSETLAARTEILSKAMIEKIQSKFTPDENGELPKEFYEEISSKVTNYTTQAEQWGNKALKAFKFYFNYPEKNEDGFMDFLTSGQEFHHLYPDNSKIGFKYKLENPVNVWYLGNANAKYTSDCWAVGTLELMSISSIIDEFKLNKDEIEQLVSKELSMEGNMMYTYNTPSLPNPNFLNYSLLYNLDILTDATLLNSLTFGTQQYHAVIKAYWKGKRKVYKRTFLDPEGYQRTEYVDEYYKFSEAYGDISLEEEWENQWYKCTRIGPYVYTEIEELEYNESAPIIGIVNHTKNTQGKSLLDLMKPYQAVYNICLNQIWGLLSKEIGVVFLGDLKALPKAQSDDPIEVMLYQAREKGAIFMDTSTENTGGNIQFNQFSRVDLTRTAELQARIQLAQALKDLCWELIGINRQRTGSILASESATGTNTALSQSYSQTEIWFKYHEDVTQQVLQSAINIMQWVELKKPESILNYINSDLDNELFKINKDELLRNLFVFVTSSKEDKDMVDALKQLMQPAMQNGADLLDMAEILNSSSENKIKDVLKKIKREKEEREQRMNEMEQQKLQQQQQQFEQQQQLLMKQHQEAIDNENMNKQADRMVKLESVKIQALGFERNEEDNTQDIITASNMALENSKHNFEKMVKTKELSQKDKELELKDKEIVSKERIAKENKSKYDSKKK